MSGSSHALAKSPLLNDGTYKFLKFMATVLLPSVGALYFGLAQIWNFPNAENVVGTIAVLNTFIGGLIGVSSMQYNSTPTHYVGSLDVEKPMDGSKTLVTVDLDQYKLSDALESSNEVVLKINNK